MAHDGTIIPNGVDTMWGTDLTATGTEEPPWPAFAAPLTCGRIREQILLLQPDQGRRIRSDRPGIWEMSADVPTIEMLERLQQTRD